MRECYNSYYPPRGTSYSWKILQKSGYSCFPLEEIHLEDQTIVDNPLPFDVYFTNDDIQTIMEFAIDLGVLDELFIINYLEYAMKCWWTQYISEWAKYIGFPNGYQNK